MLNTEDIMYLMYMENCEKEAEQQRQKEADYVKVNNQIYEDLEPELGTHKQN